MSPLVVRVESVVIEAVVLIVAAPLISEVPANVPELIVGEVRVLFSRVSAPATVATVPEVG